MTVSWFKSLPFNIQALLSICFFFLILSLLFILIIQISQLVKSVSTYFRNKYIGEIQNEVSLIVVQSAFSETPDASFQYKLKKLQALKKKSRYLSMIIMNEIVSMKKNLTGESAEYLENVYRQLGLREISISKVKSRNWKRIAKGMREIEVMQQTDTIHHLVKYLHSSNYYLRREVRLCLAGIAPKPLFFLDTINEFLSEWERMLLFEKLKQRPAELIPDFSAWYRHPNKSVVSFCVEMTVQFGQMQNIGKLEALLMEADKQLICHIIDSLRRMEAVQSLNAVGSILSKSQSSKLIISCLQFIRSIGDNSCEKIVTPFIRHKNPMVRMEAIRTLHETGASLSLNDRERRSMLAHIQHPLLS